MIKEEQRKILKDIAKVSVESFVKTGEVFDFDIRDKDLNIFTGAFVTIHRKGELRGCIGRILPSQEPLWQVVRDMAIAAASEDSRFLPVDEDELAELNYEISILSVPEKIKNWQKIELGKYGVIVERGRKLGIFLPQVATETGWGLEEFLERLCVDKAGLLPDSYKNDSEAVLKVFTVEVF